MCGCRRVCAVRAVCCLSLSPSSPLHKRAHNLRATTPPHTHTTANKQSLEVSWKDLIIAQALNCRCVAVWLADAPRPMLKLVNEAASALVHDWYPEYSHIHADIFVRFTDLPVDDNIRDLR